MTKQLNNNHTVEVTSNEEKYNSRHGGAYDRGKADAYYGKEREPHYFHGKTYTSPKFEEHQMTDGDLDAYHAGYDDGVEVGCFKNFDIANWHRYNQIERENQRNDSKENN